jgi:hypothetical protein
MKMLRNKLKSGPEKPNLEKQNRADHKSRNTTNRKRGEQLVALPVLYVAA